MAFEHDLVVQLPELGADDLQDPLGLTSEHGRSAVEEARVGPFDELDLEPFGRDGELDLVAQLRQALGLGQPSLDVFGGVGQHSLFLLERLGLVGRNRCRRAAGIDAGPASWKHAGGSLVLEDARVPEVARD